ncbi:MAG TPA: hypothetical protein VMI12_02930 [Puia sp.]|nr:hypothetical protein [Puia sp.]
MNLKSRKKIPIKKVCTLVVFFLSFFYNSEAQTYTISTNTTWSAASPAPCSSNCTFNISTGVTLIVNKSFTCSTCTFNGGIITINQNLTCQPCTFGGNTVTINSVQLKPNSSTTSFSNVNVTVNGTGDIQANTAVNITNSTFKFYNTSYFNNNGGQLNVDNSSLYFYDDSYFNANAGPVNLKNSSRLVAGDGTSTSGAYIKMNGPTLNIYDNSLISLANKNNYYFNWGSYNYYTSTSATSHTSYSTTNNNLNCGGSGQNSCSAPEAFGSATVNSSGLSAGTILPVTITSFTGDFINNHIELSWSTQEEINLDHYNIQRSTDASNWIGIGEVVSKYSAAGNSYYFTDPSVTNNENYYRLQIVDRDGKTSYSKIVSIKTETAIQQVSIFPNPVINQAFNVKLGSTDAAIVNIFTIDGRLLSVTSLKGQTQYQIQLPAGAAQNNYMIVQVISNGKTNSFNILNKK